MVRAGAPAGWHTNYIAQGIDNLSIIKLPLYSPEPNPIEQVCLGYASIIQQTAVSKDMTILLAQAAQLEGILWKTGNGL
jgi:hypothetical protein